jgi:hypothetical protein
MLNYLLCPPCPLSPMPKEVFSCRINSAHKEALLRLCEERNIKPAHLLEQMIAKVAPAQLALTNMEPIAQEETDLTSEPAKPFFLRLHKRDADELRKRAGVEKQTPQDWIRQRVRASLWKAPQFSKSEELALLESNRELSFLGRNINQIAHSLNASLNNMDLVNAAKLERLATQIKKHRNHVYSLINNNWGRYGDGEKIDE